jgi:hypothetical protein
MTNDENPMKARRPAFRPSPLGLRYSFVFRLSSFVILCLLVHGCGAPCRADDPPGEDDIPLVGRPANLPFSGASGHFEVAARAAPTSLRAGESLALTVTITADGPVRVPPRRVDLRQVPAFAEAFYLDDPPDAERHPDARTWEFAYRLRPKRADVGEVPGVPFVFFDPEIRPASRGFQVRYTDPVPLRIRPAEEYRPLPPLPDEAFCLVTGPGLLARQSPWAPPGPVALGLALLAPPLLCAGWYAAWCRVYPDAARRARRRRSRAARRALAELRRTGPAPEGGEGARVAAVVARYLRERFDFEVAEPTPAEAAAALGRAGCGDDLAGEAARLFRACDAARFVAGGDGGMPRLPAEAAQLILAVEEATWP